MAQIEIEVGGRHYEVACRDGEEDRLRMLGRLVDARVNDISRSIGRNNEARGLLLTAILLADELDEARAAAANARLDEAKRIAAIDRCAERLEELATAIEMPGLEMPGPSS